MSKTDFGVPIMNLLQSDGALVAGEPNKVLAPNRIVCSRVRQCCCFWNRHFETTSYFPVLFWSSVRQKRSERGDTHLVPDLSVCSGGKLILKAKGVTSWTFQ